MLVEKYEELPFQARKQANSGFPKLIGEDV